MALGGSPSSYYRQHSGLKYTVIGIGSFNIILWATAIGCLLGLEFDIGYTKEWRIYPLILSAVLILVNAGYIYNTSAIIFSAIGNTFPSPEEFRDMRRSCSKLVASTAIGMTVWIIDVAWYSNHNGEVPYQVLFGCSFSSFLTILFSLLAAVYERKISRTYLTFRRSDFESYSMEYRPHQEPSRPPVYRHEVPEDKYVPRRFSQQSNRPHTPSSPIHGNSAPWDVHY